MKLITIRTALFLFLLLLLAGCGQATSDPPIATLPPPTIAPATATEVPVPDTPVPTTTPVNAPPTGTPIATSTPPPSPTTSEQTPSPAAPTSQPTISAATPQPGSSGTTTTTPAATTLAAAPSAGGSVSQPPYQASSCSDKYPCNDDPAAWEARIQVPAGYKATYFAYLPGLNPTGLAFGPDSNLYVATQQGTIYTVNSAGKASAYVSGLIAPTGMEFRPGTSQLFVSSRVVEENVGGQGQLSVIENGGIRQLIGNLPCCYAFMHGPHDIVFDANGNGYLGIGARADHGEIIGQTDVKDTPHPLEASIVRFNPSSGATEKYADGLRNPYGLAIDSNGTIYATDNGPDFGPPDEFHRVVPGGQHGYPWYECDVCFQAPEGVAVIPPAYNFPAHSSPTRRNRLSGISVSQLVQQYLCRPLERFSRSSKNYALFTGRGLAHQFCDRIRRPDRCHHRPGR